MELDIHSFVSQLNLIEHGDKLLIAVSGGPDSMALLHWLVQRREEYQLTLHAIHVNHQLREADADQDQEYVEKMCHLWGVPCSSIRVDVTSVAREKRISKQAAARERRYEAFSHIAEQLGIRKLALAHHADDQVETVLMRLIRGAGLKGLAGIHPLRSTDHLTIIRPFLHLSKQQLEAYCQQHDIQPRLDLSNLADDYTRNYVRHHVVPLFTELNPQLHKTISEMTDVLREEDQWVEQEAKKYVEQVIVTKDSNKITINLSQFRHIPLPLQRRVILLILNCLPEVGTDWSKVHIDQLLRLCVHEHGNKQLHFPYDILAVKQYQDLSLLKRDSVDHVQLEQYESILPEEGELILSQLSLRVTVRKLDYSSHPLHSNETIRTTGKDKALKQGYEQVNKSVRDQVHVAIFDAQQLSFPLILRNRRAGDKIQPLGMKGHRKVKDIFIDAKLPLQERQTWPLITDQHELIWIPGIKRADRAKVSYQTQQVIMITVEKM